MRGIPFLNELHGSQKGDVDSLLRPSLAFAHPSDVVNDPDLTLNEKRAILASWASDACALDAVPTLRQLPGAQRPVSFDEVMDALRALDKVARKQSAPAGRDTGTPRRPNPTSRIRQVQHP
jgi:hypothetical protein